MKFEPMKVLVREILANPLGREWTIQGFGMLRTYLPNDVRLHVWDDRWAVPNVSLIHDHPWDFNSCIVAGQLVNERFVVTDATQGQPYTYRHIRPGLGLYPLSPDQQCFLSADGAPTYMAGDTYMQTSTMIHRTLALRGTITLVQRKRVGLDSARVFWPAGGDFVSAEPRVATTHTIREVCDNAIQMWLS